MNKFFMVVGCVVATFLCGLYIIAALENGEAIHDIHTGVEDRAIMQAGDVVDSGDMNFEPIATQVI